MAGEISFGGLISGLDTKSIVDKLTELKKQQLLSGLTKQVATLQTQQAAYSPLTTAFNTLRSASRTLKAVDNSAYTAKKSESTDSNLLRVIATDPINAVNGSYTINSVTTLARADRVLFDGVADTNISSFGTGTIALTYKGSTTNVVIDSTNNTLAGIKSAINNANAGVTASIINDGSVTPYRLVLTSSATGADTAITQDIASVLTGLTVDAVASGTSDNEPTDASYQLNGVALTSRVNTVSAAIPGVTFTLLGTSATANTITVKQDTAVIQERIKAFINTYNSVRTILKASLFPDEATKKFGPLGQDVTLSIVNKQINDITSTRFISLNDSYSTLSEVGITSDGTSGLIIDTSKLTSALETDNDAVRKLFQGSVTEDGIAEKMYTVMDNLTKAGGIFEQKNRSINTSIDRLTKLGDERQKILTQYQKRLEKQFLAMERALSSLKDQGSQLSAFSSVYESSNSKLL